jgi:superoxide dismutase
METKVCNVCNIEKQILNFYFRKDKNFYINQCNDCVKERKRIHYAQNIEQMQKDWSPKSCMDILKGII